MHGRAEYTYAQSPVSGDGNIGRDIQLCEWYEALEDHFPPELLL